MLDAASIQLLWYEFHLDRDLYRPDCCMSEAYDQSEPLTDIRALVTGDV